MSKYFIEKFGHKPIIIFDGIEKTVPYGNEVSSLCEFTEKAMEKNHYKVILSGREYPVPANAKISEYKAFTLPWVADFNQEESYQHHKTFRPADSDKIIQETYYFIKGSLVHYRRFFDLASEYSDAISEKILKKIIKKLIYRERFDFDSASVCFDLILEDTVENLKSKTHNILNAIQIMYWLIKAGSPLREKDVEANLSSEVRKFQIFKFFNADCGTPYIDFKTSLHKMYACREMGLLEYEEYNERSFEKFSNILMKRYSFKFVEWKN